MRAQRAIAGVKDALASVTRDAPERGDAARWPKPSQQLPLRFLCRCRAQSPASRPVAARNCRLDDARALQEVQVQANWALVDDSGLHASPEACREEPSNGVTRADRAERKSTAVGSED